jgi:Holliday junction resolvasome RuvABC endonuclease subunit
VSGYVWGIDVAISRLAFACAEEHGEAVAVETLTTRNDATEGERLGLLDRQVRLFARLLAARYQPAVVWVEQPSGRHRALQLAYVTGVVQAACFEALRCPVWTIPSSAWKKRALGDGRGNATKPQVAEWATSQGFAFDSQDEADAIGIAVAGRRVLAAGRWELA